MTTGFVIGATIGFVLVGYFLICVAVDVYFPSERTNFWYFLRDPMYYGWLFLCLFFAGIKIRLRRSTWLIR